MYNSDSPFSGGLTPHSEQPTPDLSDIFGNEGWGQNLMNDYLPEASNAAMDPSAYMIRQNSFGMDPNLSSGQMLFPQEVKSEANYVKTESPMEESMSEMQSPPPTLTSPGPYPLPPMFPTQNNNANFENNASANANANANYGSITQPSPSSQYPPTTNTGFPEGTIAGSALMPSLTTDPDYSLASPHSNNASSTSPSMAPMSNTPSLSPQPSYPPFAGGPQQQMQPQGQMLEPPRPTKRNRPAQPVLPAPLPFSPSSQISDMRQHIQQYLSSRGALASELVVKTSEVAQKSYGTERRFLAPPPCVTIRGPGWTGKPDMLDAVVTASFLEPPEMFPAGDSKLRPATLHSLGPTAGAASKEDSQAAVDHEGRAIFRRIFLPHEVSKNNQASMYFSVYAGAHRQLKGVFKSKPIKIVPKKLKKRFGNIVSGSLVTLFSRSRLRARARSDTATHTYLGTEGTSLVTREKEWESFRIRGLAVQDGEPLTFGTQVVLVSESTGVSTAALTIHLVERKDDSNNAVVTKHLRPQDTPTLVTQMHSIAFMISVNNGDEYISAPYDSAKVVSIRPGADWGSGPTDYIPTIDENAVWTIVNSEIVTYSYFRLIPQLDDPVSPVPIVSRLNTLNATTVEVRGQNFSDNLEVWFGDVPARTVYQCEEILYTTPPQLEAIRGSLSLPSYCTVTIKIDVPILLLRYADQTIFPTGQNYSFELSPQNQDYSNFSPAYSSLMNHT